MELSIDHVSITPIKLFSSNTPPPMRRISCYVDTEMYDEVVGIAHFEGMEVSATARELLTFALSYYQKTKELAQTTGVDISVTIEEMAAFSLTFYHKTREIAQSLDMDTTDVVSEMATFALTYYKKAKEIAIHEGM